MKVRPSSKLLLSIAAVAVLSAVMWHFFGHAFLGYDSAYALAWGKSLIHLQKPEFMASIAPTPHPLAIVIGGLASLAGDGADKVLLFFGCLSLALLVVIVFWLGSKTYASVTVGAVAAVIVGTRQELLLNAGRDIIDVPFLCLIFGALLYETMKPRRGYVVLVLLSFAGLLRPEAWLLTVAYFIYAAWPLGWPERIKLALVAASAPVIWAGMDLVATGNPLHSLTGTQELAGKLKRLRSFDALPVTLTPGIKYVLGAPVLFGGALGFVISVGLHLRKVALLAATMVVGAGVFVLLAVFNLPLLARYLLLPSVCLCIFYSFFLVGWIKQPFKFLTVVWIAAALGVAVWTAVSVPALYRSIENARHFVIARGAVQRDLKRVSVSIRKGGKVCGPVFVSNHRPVPLASYWLNVPVGQIETLIERKPHHGTAIVPVSNRVAALYVLDPSDPQSVTATIPTNFKISATNSSWKVFQSCS